jgi:hypothetical protein
VVIVPSYLASRIATATAAMAKRKSTLLRL